MREHICSSKLVARLNKGNPGAKRFPGPKSLIKTSSTTPSHAGLNSGTTRVAASPTMFASRQLVGPDKKLSYQKTNVWEKP